MSSELIELYKYTNQKTAKAVVTNKTLRWSSPRVLNDPAEFKISLPCDDQKEELLDLAMEEAWKVASGKANPVTRIGQQIRAQAVLFEWEEAQFRTLYIDAIRKSIDSYYNSSPDIVAEIQDKMQRDKILCLTANQINPMMWAHYAENGAGVVFGFRTIDLFDSPYSQARPVQYVDRKPSLYNLHDIARTIAGSRETNISEMVHQISHTKLRFWEHEQEWRIYSGAGRDPSADFEDCMFHQQELSKVIFGYRCSQEFRNSIIDIISKNYDSCELFVTKIDRQGEIEILPTSDG